MRWWSKKNHCQFHLQTATFEHRHENKTCWACPKDQHKHLTYDIWHHDKQSLLSIDMKTKVVQHVPRINISIWHLTLDTWHFTYDKVSDQGYIWRQWDSEKLHFFKCIFWANEVLGTSIYIRMVGFCWNFYKNIQKKADIHIGSPPRASKPVKGPFL